MVHGQPVQPAHMACQGGHGEDDEGKKPPDDAPAAKWDGTRTGTTWLDAGARNMARAVLRIASVGVSIWPCGAAVCKYACLDLRWW